MAARTRPSDRLIGKPNRYSTDTRDIHERSWFDRHGLWVILAGFGLLLGVVVFVRFQTDVEYEEAIRSAPCERWAYVTITQMPARCVAFYVRGSG